MREMALLQLKKLDGNELLGVRRH